MEHLLASGSPAPVPWWGRRGRAQEAVLAWGAPGSEELGCCSAGAQRRGGGPGSQEPVRPLEGPLGEDAEPLKMEVGKGAVVQPQELAAATQNYFVGVRVGGRQKEGSEGEAGV